MDLFLSPPSETATQLINEIPSKIKSTQISCIKCGALPFMTLSQEGEVMTIVFNCPCGNVWEKDIVDFFCMKWIEETLRKGVENDKDFYMELFSVKGSCFSHWRSILPHITEHFRLKLIKTCPRHKDTNNRYFCEKCSTHLCDICYEEHRDHSPIKLDAIFDEKSLKTKLDTMKEIKMMRMNLCMKANEKMISLLDQATKNAPSVSQSTGQTVDDIITQYKNLKDTLANDITYCGMMQELLELFIQMCLQISVSLEGPFNYIALMNIKSNFNFSLSQFSFPSDVTAKSNFEDILIAQQKVSKFIRESFWISPKPQPNYMDVYMEIKGIVVKQLKQIVCTSTREYGKHSVKINCVCVLGNGNVAVCGDFPVIKIFDKTNMHCIMKYEGHKAPVNYLCNLGAEYFLSCSDDKTIIKWKIKNSISRFELALKLSSKFADKVVIDAHTDKVIQVIPWGEKCFASISLDCNLKFWDDGDVPQLKKPITISGVVFKAIIIVKNTMVIAADNMIMFFDLIFCELKVNNVLNKISCGGTNCLKHFTGSLVLVGGNEGITIVDCETYQIVQRLYEEEFAMIGAFKTLSPYSFLCANEKGFFAFKFNTLIAQKMNKYSLEGSATPTSLAEIDEKNFITVSYDSKIKKWELFY